MLRNNLIPNHANDVINAMSRMKLTAIIFLIQSMIYLACIKRDGLLDEPSINVGNWNWKSS